MWKTLSQAVDEAVVAVHCAFGARGLRGSGPGAPPPLDELRAEQEARPPEIRWPARFERRDGRIRIRMPVIAHDTFADFHPARGPSDTLFVYHHGLGEFPHDGSASRILRRGRIGERVDWIAIRGPHHDTRAAVDERLLFSQESLARGLLSSVYTARALAAGLRARYRHVVLGGMSLGGVITLVESALGSEFDLSVPLMAGPDLESVLLRSTFSRVVCRAYRARAAETRLSTALDLGARLGAGGPPIRAVLARWDRLFHLEPQLAAYARVPRAAVTVIDGGHVTGAIQFARLADVVAGAVETVLWRGRPVEAPGAAAFAA